MPQTTLVVWLLLIKSPNGIDKNFNLCIIYNNLINYFI